MSGLEVVPRFAHWWAEREAKYPHKATTRPGGSADAVGNVRADPQEVQMFLGLGGGDFISAGLVGGGRAWGFTSEAARDRFCKIFEGEKQ